MPQSPRLNTNPGLAPANVGDGEKPGGTRTDGCEPEFEADISAFPSKGRPPGRHVAESILHGEGPFRVVSCVLLLITLTVSKRVKSYNGSGTVARTRHTDCFVWGNRLQIALQVLQVRLCTVRVRRVGSHPRTPRVCTFIVSRITGDRLGSRATICVIVKLRVVVAAILAYPLDTIRCFTKI